MIRYECNVQTGEITEVTLSPEEEAWALAAQTSWAEQNTLDNRGARSIDAADRLRFEIDYDQESRLRVLEGRSAITRVQYRDALIVRWKALNS